MFLKEVLWSWWAWKRNDVPSWRRRSSTVSSAGSKRKIPRVWSVDPMVLEWCKKQRLGRHNWERCFWDGRVEQLIYDISLEIILMFDMWFMMFPMSDIMNHVTQRFTDQSSELQMLRSWMLEWSWILDRRIHGTVKDLVPEAQGSYNYNQIWLVVWNIWLFFHRLGIIIPTDELHHFSEGWLNHQPKMCCGIQLLSLEPLWIHLSGYQLTIWMMYMALITMDVFFMFFMLCPLVLPQHRASCISIGGIVPTTNAGHSVW